MASKSGSGKKSRISISERKWAEEALSASEDRFREMAETINSAFWVSQFDSTGALRYVYMSPAFERIFGIPVDLIYEDPRVWLKLIHPEDIERFVASQKKRAAGEYVDAPDIRIIKPDGTVRWIRTSLSPVKGDDGKILRYVGLADDITERKQAEEALLESEARFRSLLESSIDVVYRLNVQTGRFEYVSPSAETVMGYTPGEYIAMNSATALSMIHPDDLPGMRTAMERLNVTGSSEAVYRQRAKNGEYRWMSNHMSLIRDDADRPLYRNGNIRDITELRRAEEAIRETACQAENRARELKAVIDAMPDGLTIYDKDGQAMYINEVSRKILASYSIEDVPPIEGRTEKAKVCRSDGTPITLEDTPLYHALKKGEVIKDFVVMARKGQIYTSLGCAPIRDSEGEITGAVATHKDITERKRAEEALRESEKLQRAIFENAGAGIVWGLQDGIIQKANNKFCEIVGYSPSEIVGMNFADLTVGDFLPEEMRRVEEVIAGLRSGYTIEKQYRKKDGSLVWVSMTSSVSRYQDGRITGVVAIVEDITERRRAEKALKDAKALSELYLDLMGHDINNMHQIALGYLELAQGLAPGVQQGEMIGKSVEVLQRSTQLIRNVRKLQKHGDGVFQRSEYDLVRVITDVARESGAVPRKTVTLNMNGHRHCYVMANELLHDVFANLVSNAIKHTGDRADISVGLETVHDNGGRYYLVSVEDNGPGVPDDFKGAIFNRTLKGTSKARGMGLGLYLVKSLVESYKGRAWVEDRMKGDHMKGARFVVMLPAVEQ